MGCSVSVPHAAPPLDLSGTYRARISAVHTATELEGILRWRGAWHAVPLQLAGVHVPEIFPAKRNRAQTEKAKLARDTVSQRVLKREVQLECGCFNERGRIWVVVRQGTEELNAWLVTSGLAQPCARTTEADKER